MNLVVAGVVAAHSPLHRVIALEHSGVHVVVHRNGWVLLHHSGRGGGRSRDERGEKHIKRIIESAPSTQKKVL